MFAKSRALFDLLCLPAAAALFAICLPLVTNNVITNARPGSKPNNAFQLSVDLWRGVVTRWTCHRTGPRGRIIKIHTFV